MLAVVEEGFKSKEEILKQIEHIHWYKMANQNALQAAILDNKIKKPNRRESKSNDGKIKTNYEFANFTPKQHVPSRIPNIKPNSSMRPPGMGEIETAKLSQQIEMNINSLNRLKQKLEDKNQFQSRSHDYRLWKKEFVKKKDLLLNSASPRNCQLADTLLSNLKPSISAQLPETAASTKCVSKLEEIESRIWQLEQENQKRNQASNTQTLGQSLNLNGDFSNSKSNKKYFERRHGRSNNFTGTILSPNQTDNQSIKTNTSFNSAASATASASSHSSSTKKLRVQRPHHHDIDTNRMQRSNKTKFSQYYVDNLRNQRELASKIKSKGPNSKRLMRPGFFLTQINENYEDDIIGPTEEDVLKEKRRKWAQATESQKSLRQRILAKKQRIRDMEANKHRQREALRASIKLKKKIIQSEIHGSSSSGRLTGAGVSSDHGFRIGNTLSYGLGTKGAKNKYLHEFERIKIDFDKKKAMAANSLRGSVRINQSQSTTHQPVYASRTLPSRVKVNSSSSTLARSLLNNHSSPLLPLEFRNGRIDSDAKTSTVKFPIIQSYSLQKSGQTSNSHQHRHQQALSAARLETSLQPSNKLTRKLDSNQVPTRREIAPLRMLIAGNMLSPPIR